MALMRVDLPAPFSPSSACVSPARISRPTPFSATTPGKRLTMPLASRNGAPCLTSIRQAFYVCPAGARWLESASLNPRATHGRDHPRARTKEDQMRIRPCLLLLCILVTGSLAAAAPVNEPTRDIKIVSSAGARALADACSAWAERKNLVVAMAILDW